MSRFHLSVPLLLALTACTGEKVPAADDSGTDSRKDSEPTDDTGDSKESNPQDTDTGDSNVDSEDSVDSVDSHDSQDSAEPPDNMLRNPGFELGNDGAWLIYPTNLTNYAYEQTGNPIYQSSDLFTAYEGVQSLKVFGQYWGGPNETPIYQEFPAVGGEVYTFSGYAWMHRDDPLTVSHTYALLSLKYFDDSYNFLGHSDSIALTNLSAADVWTNLTVTGTVPVGATKVQAAIEYWQCVGDLTGACFDGNGGVYFDQMWMTKDGEVVDSGDSGSDSGDSGGDSGDSGGDSGDSGGDSDSGGSSSSADPTARMYFSGSSFSNTAPAAASLVIPATTGYYAGTLPTDPTLVTVVQATGLNGTYNGGGTAFTLAVDGNADYGQAVQTQFDYDFDGDGTVDRTEMYNLFATDAATGWESYMENFGLLSQSGAYADFVNGSVTVSIWKAFQPDPAFAMVYDESQSWITLPYGSGGSTIGLANGDFENGADGSWLIYPSNLTNYSYESTGSLLYNSTDTFSAYDGITSLKVYGQWSGYANETPIYQEFAASPGDTFTFSGYAWMHHDDPLTASHTYAYLSLKYFDNNYTFYGSSDSALFDVTQPVDTWTLLTASGTVPAGATKVQAAIEFWQCVNDTSGACYDGFGAVYFDDLVLQ